MRIGINCRSFLKKDTTGIGRYARNLVHSLAGLDDRNEYWLYVPKRLFDRTRAAPRPPAAHFRIKTDYLNRGPEKVLKGADVYHLPSPGPGEMSSARVVVTIHDLIHKVYPDVHPPDARAVMEAELNNLLRRADKIICCSRSTIDDLTRFYDVDEDLVRLIYQGVDKEVFYPLDDDGRRGAREVLRAKGVDGPFLLAVGTLEPRKNLKNLVKAFAVLKEEKMFDGKLVVAGGRGWMMEKMGDWLRESGVRDECLFLGYLSDDALRGLYNLTEVFVFPSFYEGFGFPIVEAMSCGAAVVTSNVSACGEIAGDGALTVDPASPEKIAEAVGSVIRDADLKKKMRQRALERAKVFSFRNTAEQTLEVYESLA